MPQHSANRAHAWVLDQDEVWVDVFGREHALASMDREYRALGEPSPQ